MMREILFRGKRTYNGKWVEGFYLYTNVNTQPVIIDIDCCSNVIIPETVGQYTGLTDKNGVRIFEGDIVELTDVNNDIKWNAIVVFGNPYGEYCWGWNLMYVGANPKVNTDILCWVDMEDSGAFIEVIGNIHDNPELLDREECENK